MSLHEFKASITPLVRLENSHANDEHAVTQSEHANNTNVTHIKY